MYKGLMRKNIEPKTMQRVQEWLDGPFDEKTKEEIRHLLKNDEKALSDAFFKDLSFGTGGMRGIMGVGTNRMNTYTIHKATQGLANYVNKHTKKQASAFIGYDVRHHSRQFAEETARVLAGNGIRVFLTKEICPTPLVSFGCRHFGCQTAIMITASHNPPQYNGYKVYWADGAQVVHPHDSGIMKEVANINDDIHVAPLNSPLIQSIGEELDKAYLHELKKLQLHPEFGSSDVKILYSPLHGTGIRILPKALQSWGFSNIHLVPLQSSPDGDFPFAPLPNPEEHETLALGSKQLIDEHADLLIATDPDADRVGIVERGQSPFTGNQIACILLQHICEELTESGKFPPHATFVKTIVTTELFKKIAENYGGICVDVLTGFKYIGEKIAAWEAEPNEHKYVFGAEESCGYLFGTFVRDKDAINTACLIAEAAAKAKKEKMTLLDRLYLIYQKYGIHRELLVNISFTDSLEGMKQMQELMQQLRTDPPKKVDGRKVAKVEDYLHGYQSFPPSDVLRLWLEDHSKLVIRPSGTEPKIKIYIEITEKASKDISKQIKHCDERLKSLAHFFQKLLSDH